jgi:hypothetical protein
MAMIMATASLDRIDEARAMMARALQMTPEFTAERIRRRTPYRRPQDTELMMRALAQAGLPE